MSKQQLRLEDMVNNNDSGKPKILTIDIETSPITAYTWGPKFESNIIDFVTQSQVLSYSAKWLGGKQITKGLIDYKGYAPGIINDKPLIKDVHGLLDEADIVVGQNHVSFDMKILNARMIANGMSPPSPYKMVDTKREAKKYLRLPSYSLNDMGAYFGIGKKMEHEGFNLWLGCMKGDKSAWKKMKAYNAQDTLLTEQLYLKLLPFMKTHPNVGSHVEGCVCGKCGSERLQRRGVARTLSTVYQRVQCLDCGGWGRSQTKERSYKVTPNI
jgi:DNA polymerase elongation subunit (family B)